MAAPLTAALPEGLKLDAGYTITLDAVDPATGAPVAGVVVSDATISASELQPGLDLGEVGSPILLGISA